MFRAGSRVSDALRELHYSKVKILWGMILNRIAIIIIQVLFKPIIWNWQVIRKGH